MSLFDYINGAFELSGAYFVWLSIRELLRSRRVEGVDWRTMGFFSAWGIWNLFYYPSLEQWASFVGGILVVSANLTYMALIIYYRRRAFHG